jgi:hypothetical protein
LLPGNIAGMMIEQRYGPLIRFDPSRGMCQ